MDIALLGAGLMGRPVGARLLQRGHRLMVYNRTPDKLAALHAAGARPAASPAEALSAAEWTVCALADADALRATLLAPGSLPQLPGRRILNLGTIAPEEARALGAAIADHGGEFMECPVLGSIPEAERGELILMFGGEPDQFAAAGALLEALGPAPVHVGPLGRASALKLALNQLIATLTTAFAMSLGLVRREGIGIDTFMDVLRASALYAPTFDKKLARMRDRDFGRPNFPLEHLLKDVRLFETAAATAGADLDTGVLRAIEDILIRAQGQGLATLDYSALYEIVDPAS